MQADRRIILGRYLECKPEQVHTTELKEDYIILWYVFILHTSIKGAAFATMQDRKWSFSLLVKSCNLAVGYSSVDF